MEKLSDDQKERIAIEVQDLPPDEAQAEYERRVRELEAQLSPNKIGSQAHRPR